MSTPTDRRTDQKSTAVSDHLTVRPEGDGPPQARFMFEQPDSKRIGGALGAGFLTELCVIGLVLLIGSLLPERVYQAVIPAQLSDKIVWLAEPGPGGGGGGGNKMPDPPKPAEIVKPKPAAGTRTGQADARGTSTCGTAHDSTQDARRRGDNAWDDRIDAGIQ